MKSPLFALGSSLILFHIHVMATTSDLPNSCALKLSANPRTQIARHLIDVAKMASEPGQRIALLRAEKLRFDQRLQVILGRPLTDRTFANTVGALDAALAPLNATRFWLEDLYRLQPLDEKESAEVIELSSHIESSVFQDEKLYRVIQSVQPQGVDEKKLYEILQRFFRQSGVALPPEVLEKARELHHELKITHVQFSENLQKSDSVLNLSENELEGVAPQRLASWPKNAEGLFAIPVGDPRYRSEILTSARSEETRRRAYLKCFDRAESNLPLVIRKIELQKEMAQLTKSGSFLDSVIDETTLPGDAATVQAMVENLNSALKIPIEQLMQKMQRLKAAEVPGATIRPWDILYYEKQLNTKEDKATDFAAYFPADQTLPRILGELGNIFGVEFREVPNAPVWHPSVKLYEVWDARDSGAPASYLYVDAFSRPGKAPGQSYVSMHSYSFGEGSNRQASFGLLVTDMASFENAGTEGIPRNKMMSLLHELGHAMHLVFHNPRWYFTGLSSFGSDFMEIPSTVFESFTENPTFLDHVSGERVSGQKIPEELARAKAVSFKLTDSPFYQPIFLNDRLMLTNLDLKLHGDSADPVDPHKIYAQVYEDFYGIASVSEDHFVEVFHHLFSGYSGVFYSYIWAAIATANINPKIAAAGGLEQPGVAAHFRDEFLNAREPTASGIVDKFLGGPVRAEPVMKLLGVESTR